MRKQTTFLHEIYEFSGSPYEIGLQRGKLWAQHINKVLEKHTYNPYYAHRLTSEQYNLDYLKKNYPSQFKLWERALEKTPKWFQDDARGIADGTDVPYEKVISSVGWFPFFLKKEIELGPKVLRHAPTHQLEEDCNGFIAYNKATDDGRVIIGGNSEGSHAAIRGLSVLRMKNKVGNSFVMNNHKPGLRTDGQAGINEKGVCIFGSGVSINHDVWGDVGYRQIIRRRVLQDANNLDEAIDLFKEGPLLGGQHIYLADSKRAVHIEYTGKHVEIIDPESGFDAGSSPYFSSPKMTPLCNVLTDETDPDFTYQLAKKRGVFRMERYHELFQEKKPLSLDMIPSILGDHGGRGTGIIRENIEGACPQGSDYTICAHGRERRLGEFHANAWSCILVPDERKLYLAFGSPCEAGYVPFKPPK